jgi:hypothetical protein
MGQGSQQRGSKSQGFHHDFEKEKICYRLVKEIGMTVDLERRVNVGLDVSLMAVS